MHFSKNTLLNNYQLYTDLFKFEVLPNRVLRLQIEDLPRNPKEQDQGAKESPRWPPNGKGLFNGPIH